MISRVISRAAVWCSFSCFFTSYGGKKKWDKIFSLPCSSQEQSNHKLCMGVSSCIYRSFSWGCAGVWIYSFVLRNTTPLKQPVKSVLFLWCITLLCDWPQSVFYYPKTVAPLCCIQRHLGFQSLPTWQKAKKMLQKGAHSVNTKALSFILISVLLNYDISGYCSFQHNSFGQLLFCGGKTF